MKKEILKTLGAISLMLALALVVGYVGTAFGWTPAPASPPADNTPAPVNVGYDQQTRKGQLILDGTTLLDGIETALKYPLVISRGAILLGVQDTAVSDGIANLALDVAGKIRIRDAAGAGKVLTSDANGVAGWATPEPSTGSSANFYDSGWFAISGNTKYVKTHNLGTTAVISELWTSSSANGSNPTRADVMVFGGNNVGITLSELTNTTVNVKVFATWIESNPALPTGSTPVDGSFLVKSSGYARVVMYAPGI